VTIIKIWIFNNISPVLQNVRSYPSIYTFPCGFLYFVVGGYYGFELSWVNFVADYHSHPLIRMIIWRNLLDPYAAMDRPAAICDISYLLADEYINW
jgi:hypothetical protein